MGKRAEGDEKAPAHLVAIPEWKITGASPHPAQKVRTLSKIYCSHWD